MTSKRLHIFFSGSVQGVGFRFTTEKIAYDLGVNGWVKNLRDGRVEVLCEGDESALRLFLQRVRDAMSGFIDNVDAAWGDASGEFRGFQVRIS